MEGGRVSDYPNAGGMNRKIALQSVVRTKDAYGIASEAWTTYATPWASIKTLSGTEQEINKTVVGASRIQVMIRYHPEVTHVDRITYNGRTFLINSVDDVNEMHAQMKITATEVLDG